MSNNKVNSKLSAAEIAAQDAAIAATKSNFEARQGQVWKELEALAADTANAAASYYKMNILFQDSVRENLVAHNDNVKFYKHYFDTVKSKLAEKNLRAGKEGISESSFNSQCSKLKGFGNPAAVHLGETLYATIDAVWMELPKEARATSSMSAAYNRINTRAQALLKKQCKGDLAAMQAIVFGKDNVWLRENLSESAAEQEAEETDETDGADDETAPKDGLTKLNDIVLAMLKLSKKEFEGDVRFAKVAAYVSKLHGTMVVESQESEELPKL